MICWLVFQIVERYKDSKLEVITFNQVLVAFLLLTLNILVCF